MILSDFTLHTELSNIAIDLKENIKSKESVSIHIRRADLFPNNPNSVNYAALPLSYYVDALQIIRNDIINPFYFIFTDDIEWTVKTFVNILDKYIICSKSKLQDYEELYLMSQCKHNIIANSTFSWWSAWLNNNDNKKVVCPSKWFEKDEYDTKDLLPSHWIKI